MEGNEEMNRMTNEQEEHLEKIQIAFQVLANRKYRAGQKEHGGNLFDKTIEQLLDNAIDEAIDQVIYLLSIKMKIKEH